MTKREEAYRKRLLNKASFQSRTREELISKQTCIACQEAPMVTETLYCRGCLQVISRADFRASDDAVRTVRAEYCGRSGRVELREFE